MRLSFGCFWFETISFGLRGTVGGGVSKRGNSGQKEGILSRKLTEGLDLGANPCNNYSVHLDEFGGVSVWQK